MNFFQSLLNGVQGLLQGKILRVRTQKSKKSGKDYVKATVGVPELMIKFDVFIPERFVPDAIEGKEIQLYPDLQVNGFNDAELKLEVEKII